MGLDIWAYKNLRPCEARMGENGWMVGTDEDGMESDTVRLNVNSKFPGRECQVKDGQDYLVEEITCFNYGSHSSYGDFREKLAEIAGYKAVHVYFEGGVMEERHAAGAWLAECGPFWEMINFSDCDGVIGASICAKLAKDFADFQEQADEQDEFFAFDYRRFRSAFELGQHNGAVKFS